MILQKIVEKKKEEISLIKDFSNLEASNRNFKACLKGRHNIIAEIKMKSPSAGKLFDGDVNEIVKEYDRYANAISIVTDKEFFGGDKGIIKEVKELTSLPVLCKDFIIDEKQILELRHYGADAILLIASLLSKEKIDEFISVAKKYNMDCVVEVHTEEELKKVLDTKAEIIGINNRGLSSFDVDLETTKRLKSHIPNDKIVISESGFSDIKEIMSVDTHAVLIGTSLLKGTQLSSLRRPKVKICGITNIPDALDAVEAGADFLGFNFYEKSPRYIKPEDAKKIIEKLPNTVTGVGVFVNEDVEKVKEIIKTGIDMLQFHGDESAEYCSSFSLPVIKAFKVDKELPDIRGYKVFAYLLDAFDNELYGGTGKSFDLNIIEGFTKKLFVSGGLRLDNVKEALKIDPYCIDVCSGVEKEKGIKDKEKIKRFIENAK